MKSNFKSIIKGFCGRIAVVLLFCMTAVHGHATERDDCILNGLKGVSGEAGARMVREACDNKAADKRKQEIQQKYGEPSQTEIDVLSLTKDNNQPRVTMVVKNTAPKTALFIRVQLWLKFLNCESSNGFEIDNFVYKVKIKPNQTANLLVDKYFLGDLCSKATIIRARDSSVLDVALNSTYNVISLEDSREIGDALNDRMSFQPNWTTKAQAR